MKTKYKYILLIIITIVASILIYRFVEASTAVDTKDDILWYQESLENGFLANKNYSITEPNVIVNPYGNSPLTALVIFQTKDLATVTITVKGKDGDEDIVNTFIPSKDHIIPVYGLYPDYENQIIIASSGEESTLTIKTDKLPDWLKNGENVESSEANGPFFTTSNNENGHPVAYDKNGNVRWYLNTNYRFNFTRLSNGHILLSNDSNVNSPNYSIGLVEIDLLGKVYYEYNLPGGYHHDVYELNNGNLLVASNNFGSGTVEDYIVEIDRAAGNIVKKFDLYNVMPNDDGAEWLKLKSFTYDVKTNSISLIGSKKDMIINIDYNTSEINWIIADKNKLSEKYHKYLLTDGDAMLPENPSALTLTKNGLAYINGADDKNQLIEYSINTANKTFKELKNVELGPKAEYTNISYKDDAFIISLDNKVKTYKDKLVDNFSTSYNLYSATVSDIYAGDVYMPGRGGRIGTTGETPTVKNLPLIFYAAQDKVFEQYDLEVYKDANRLVVSGTFNKNDKVSIILDNVLDKKTYDVTMSETPYKNTKKKDSKIKVTSYINEEGLAGKYYIYLKVNDTTYKLHKYTVFY